MRFVLTPTALLIAITSLAVSPRPAPAGQTLAVGARSNQLLETSDPTTSAAIFSTTIDSEERAIDDAENAAALYDFGYLAFQVPEPPPWLLVTIVIGAYLFRRRSREDRS